METSFTKPKIAIHLIPKSSPLIVNVGQLRYRSRLTNIFNT